MQTGRIEAIYVGASAGELPRATPRARAVPGRGLEGDRYFERSGTFSHKGAGNGRDLTLIESEALAELGRTRQIELRPEQARRNLLTSGVSLNDLVGRRFRVGSVECIGRRLCDPCSHLEQVTQPGVLKGLVDRGGLRADILTEGEIIAGDELVELTDDG